MKKLLLISLLAIFLSSCLTVGRIQRNCAEFAKICNVTTTIYKDTTIYRKDTIRIKLPGDTVTINRPITVNGTQVSLEPVSVSKGLISAKAWVYANRLMVDAWLNKPYVETVHRDTITITKIVRETGNTVTIREKYIPAFYKYSGMFMIFLMVVGVGYFTIKFGLFSTGGPAVKLLTRLKGLL